jgi:hypothetical protein
MLLRVRLASYAALSNLKVSLVFMRTFFNKVRNFYLV